MAPRKDAVSKKTIGKIEKLAEGVLKTVAGGKNPFLDIPVRSLANVSWSEKRRLVEVDKSLITTSAKDVIDDPNVEIVIELIGGEDPAREYVRRSLEHKKSVVTANKLLLAMQEARRAVVAGNPGSAGATCSGARAASRPARWSDSTSAPRRRNTR